MEPCARAGREVRGVRTRGGRSPVFEFLDRIWGQFLTGRTSVGTSCHVAHIEAKSRSINPMQIVFMGCLANCAHAVKGTPEQLQSRNWVTVCAVGASLPLAARHCRKLTGGTLQVIEGLLPGIDARTCDLRFAGVRFRCGRGASISVE
jgi:hypothetical protein